MRVALVSTQIYAAPPDTYGGLEAVVGDLASALDARGVEVSLFAPVGSTAWTPESKSHLYACGKPGTVDEVTAWQNYMRDPRSRKALLEADVVHDHSWEAAPYLLRNEPKAPPVLHTNHAMNPFWVKPPPWDRMNLCGIGFAQTQHLRSVTHLPWRWVHNGVNPARYPARTGTGNGRLLWISRLWPYKGPLEAIEIAEAANRPIDIVGGSFGDVASFVEVVKRRCERSPVAKFHGEVTHDRKVEFLQTCDAVLLPLQPRILRCTRCGCENPWSEKSDGPCIRCSAPGLAATPDWIEPFGLISVEANLCGAPILVTPCGGYAETVVDGGNGWLCQSREDFQWGLEHLTALGDAAWLRASAVERFGSDRMARNYLRLYEQVIKGASW